MFLAGSIGDLVLTLAFIPILYVHCPLHRRVGVSDFFSRIKFPSFLLKVVRISSQVFDREARLTFMVFEWQKAEGVDTSTMVRLRKFHELNVRTDTTSLS